MMKAMLASLLMITCSAQSNEVQFEYISPARYTELEELFNKSKFDPTANTDVLKASNWICEMYGVRSRIRIQRGINLYRWKQESDWKNEGSQVVNTYHVEGASLAGRSERFADEIRLTANGQLVSRLSVTAPRTSVIAYSVCKIL